MERGARGGFGRDGSEALGGRGEGRGERGGGGREGEGGEGEGRGGEEVEEASCCWGEG